MWPVCVCATPASPGCSALLSSHHGATSPVRPSAQRPCSRRHGPLAGLEAELQTLSSSVAACSCHAGLAGHHGCWLGGSLRQVGQWLVPPPPVRHGPQQGCSRAPRGPLTGLSALRGGGPRCWSPALCLLCQLARHACTSLHAYSLRSCNAGGPGVGGTHCLLPPAEGPPRGRHTLTASCGWVQAGARGPGEQHPARAGGAGAPGPVPGSARPGGGGAGGRLLPALAAGHRVSGGGALPSCC